MKALFLGLLLLLPAATVSLAQGETETRASAVASGDLRMKVQRAARQYVMFQYGVGTLSVSKQPLLDTVEELDQTLRRLEADAGSPGVRSQIKLLAEKWDRLRKIYTYQPYKLFQAKELLPPAVRKQDPVLVRYVDRLTQELLAECELLIDAYERECGPDGCQPLVRDIGTQMLLTEAVTNNLLFTVLDIDSEQRRERLGEKAAALDASLRESRSPGYYGGNPSVLIEPVLETIAAYWAQMKASVDLALGGDEDEVNLDQMLRSQGRLLEEIDQLTAILAGR